MKKCTLQSILIMISHNHTSKQRRFPVLCQPQTKRFLLIHSTINNQHSIFINNSCRLAQQLLSRRVAREAKALESLRPCLRQLPSPYSTSSIKQTRSTSTSPHNLPLSTKAIIITVNTADEFNSFAQ